MQLSTGSSLFPYTTRFRSPPRRHLGADGAAEARAAQGGDPRHAGGRPRRRTGLRQRQGDDRRGDGVRRPARSEEHTSELQSLAYLVCRLLLEKNKTHAPRRSRSPTALCRSPCSSPRALASFPTRRASDLPPVDTSVLMERPKLAPHKAAIRDTLAGALGVAPACVNVKATTGEGMGFVGR